VTEFQNFGDVGVGIDDEIVATVEIRRPSPNSGWNRLPSRRIGAIVTARPARSRARLYMASLLVGPGAVQILGGHASARRLQDREEMMGLEAYESTSFTLQDCRVSGENLLGGEARYEKRAGFETAMRIIMARKLVGLPR
jgi:hypothetical protein